MRCRHCDAELTAQTPNGEPLIRNRGIVLKPTGAAVLRCPRCRGEVEFDPMILSIAPVLVFTPNRTSRR
jgi:hypothetical protein